VSCLQAVSTFQQFADLLPFGAYIVDPARKIVYWNRRAEQITGFLAQEVVGHSCDGDLLVHCGASGLVLCSCPQCPLLEVLRSGQSKQKHLYLQHKQGHRVPVLVRVLPLRDEHGRIEALAEIFQEESAGPEGLCWITEKAQRVDPELGIASMATTREQVELSLALPRVGLAAFLLTIEGLSDLSRSRGSEIVLLSLRALVQTVSHLLTMPHFLGRWTNQRLLALVPNCDYESLSELKLKIEAAGSACAVVWWGDRVSSHVSVRATIVQPDDSLEALMFRLDPQSESAASAAGD
jgi:PAS domain S-box-containing protein